MEPSLATAPSLYPFGLTNVAASYATTLVSIHQRHAHNPIVTTPIHPHSDSSEEDEAWVGTDFSGIRDPEAMRHFMIASDYCFGHSDSDGEDAYNPTRECFHIRLGMPSTGNDGGRAANATPPRTGSSPAAAGVPTPEQLRRIDLEQLRELQAKVEQDRLLLQQLRATLEQEQRGRGDGGTARLGARDVNRRINDDEGGEQPPVFNRASQNIAAAAILVQAMPEPSTTEG